MATGHVKTFRSQKYKIKTTKPVPVSRLEGTEFFECLNQFSLILNQNKDTPEFLTDFKSYAKWLLQLNCTNRTICTNILVSPKFQFGQTLQIINFRGTSMCSGLKIL